MTVTDSTTPVDDGHPKHDITRLMTATTELYEALLFIANLNAEDGNTEDEATCQRLAAAQLECSTFLNTVLNRIRKRDPKLAGLTA